MKFPSKKQIEEEVTQFSLLPADDYEIIISEIKEEIQNKYLAKPDEQGVTPQEQVLRCIFSVVGFKDGTPAKDDDGNNAKERKLFFTGRPESIGFQLSGVPAKTRCLIAYATGQKIDDELVLDNWQDLVGKTLFVEVMQGKNTKGKDINKVSRIIPPRVNRENTSETPQDPHDRIDKFLDKEVAKDKAKEEEINVEDLDME